MSKAKGGAGATGGAGEAGGPDEALRALERGEIETAARLFREALAKDKDDVRALVGIGKVAFLLSRLPEATEAARRALAKAPGDRDALLLSGVTAEADGKHDDAIARYRAAAEGDGKSMLARFQLGRALGVAKKYDEAAKELRAAAKLAPASYEVEYALALVLEGGGDTAGGIEALSRAIEKNAGFLDGYITLGDLLAKAGKLDLARKVVAQAQSLFPRSGIVADKAAALAYKAGDLDQTLVQLERQVDLEPENARAYLNLSTFSQLAGDMARAERAAERLAAIDPKSWEAQFHLGSIYEAVGLVEKAKTRHRAAIERSQKAWQPRSDLGRILASEGAKDRVGEGAKLLEEAVKLAPADEPGPRMNLALARLALGEKKKAATLLKDVLAKLPQGHGLRQQAADALSAAEAK